MLTKVDFGEVENEADGEKGNKFQKVAGRSDLKVATVNNGGNIILIQLIGGEKD